MTTSRAPTRSCARRSTRSTESVIRAPFPGVVTERFIQRGEFVQVGAATVRLVNTSDIEARATAALDLAANVHPGQTVTRARSRQREARHRAHRGTGRVMTARASSRCA